MKYAAILYNDVIVAKSKNYTDNIDKNEIELTEKQYNSIPIPCKLVNGEFVPSEFPKVESPQTDTNASVDDILNTLLGVTDDE